MAYAALSEFQGAIIVIDELPDSLALPESLNALFEILPNIVKLPHVNVPFILGLLRAVLADDCGESISLRPIGVLEVQIGAVFGTSVEAKALS